MARELGKQDQRIGECLGELARVGLISYGLAGEEFGVITSEEFDWLAYDCKYLPRLQGSMAASWWGARSCQKKRTLFYRLLVRLEEVLPSFEPFGNGSSAGSTSGQEQHDVQPSGNDRNRSAMIGLAVANGGNDQLSRAWNDPGRNVRPVQKELELHQNELGTTRNDLNRLGMTWQRVENDREVLPRSFPGASLNSLCSNVLNDDDVVDDDEEIIRSREYNSGTIKAKTHPDQSSITRPATLKDNSSQAQPLADEQEEWHGYEKEQGKGQEEAEEPAREEVELEQVVRRATRLMQYQSQQGDGEDSNDGEVAGNSVVGEDICSEDGQDSRKETYPTTKVTSPSRGSSTKTSFTSPSAQNFSFREPAYNSQPRQSYYRNNNSSHNGARSRNTRSDWQSGGYSRYQPSYQPWTGSNSAEEEEVVPVYDVEGEKPSTQTEEMYPPQSTSAQQIDPVVTLERICNWLRSILRRPDLARKLAGARLELGVDESGNNKATFWMDDGDIDPRSFSLEDKSLIRMAFSSEVAPHYKLQLANGQVVVSIE